MSCLSDYDNSCILSLSVCTFLGIYYLVCCVNYYENDIHYSIIIIIMLVANHHKLKNLKTQLSILSRSESTTN